MDFINSLPILPLVITLLFVVAGILLLYFLYILPKRKKYEVNIPVMTIPNIPPPPATLNTNPYNPKGAGNEATVNKENIASNPSLLTNPSVKPAVSNISLNSNSSTPFYKNSIFLIIVFALLLVAIPTVIYFGVKRQQSLSGKAADACNDMCNFSYPEPNAQSNCYINAGSGCDWRPYGGNRPNWEGECYCARNAGITPTPPGTTGSIDCNVGKNGGSVTNNTNINLKCTGTYSSCGQRRETREQCFANPRCNGDVHSIGSFDLPKESSSQTWGSQSDVSCGVWQVDLTITCDNGFYCTNADNDCEWDDASCSSTTPTPTTPTQSTPTPTPTTPVASGQCTYLRIYNSEGILITDYSTIRANQIIRLAVMPSSSQFTHGRFQVNSGAFLPTIEGTTQKNTTGEFYLDYTVPAGTTSFSIKAMVKHPTLGWK